MPKAPTGLLQPRKTPRQARSTASVGAILEATIQVLLREGKAKLTTTRIAARAGVSVGTLYQYFPNKRSLLQALLREHLQYVAVSVEAACAAAHGKPLAVMAEAITTSFVEAKFRDTDAGIALYSVSDDIEGRRIAQTMYAEVSKSMIALFESSPETSFADPELVATTILSAMAGISRTMLEAGVTRKTKGILEQQLTVLVNAYLKASAALAPESHPRAETASRLAQPSVLPAYR